ncbi:ribokinase [Pacificibacter sp. AS14]|uniref:ribokinase n=1 Tax=Pacificibacter sp. AS14 TaxID=3135785 RepID=UPI0031757445
MKVFIVGNIAMDQTIGIDRFPNEGESIFGSRVSLDLGGKGANQAIVLGRSGVPTILIAAVGTDLQSQHMRDLLAKEPVVSRLIKRHDCASDTTVVLKDAAGGNANIATVDCARSVDLIDVLPLMADAVAGDLLVLQGNLQLSTTADLIAQARKQQMLVAFNPSPFDREFIPLLPSLDILFLNEHEAEQITGKADEAAVYHLLDMNIATVVLTLGARGALLGQRDAARGSDIVAVPAHKCHVVDSTGAGDTLQSVTIGSAILRGSKICAHDLDLAVRAAAITVTRPGTTAAFPTQQELETLSRKLEVPLNL